ncbi:MAG: pyridoxamine 5'-phosphate oxidase family protein [Methanosphaera sp.]|nr:pyridoxamine 5'-phosphate oxidase family protein [Methanosphaera sp.]
MDIPQMRKKEYELTDIDEIKELVDNAEIMHIGINNGEYPVVEPLSYGYEIIDKTIVLYFHGSYEGFRYELLKKDNHVCVTINSNVSYVHDNPTANFDSIVGYGEAVEIEKDTDERVKAMELILKNYGMEDVKFPPEAFNGPSVFKIVLDNYQAKRKQDM